LSPSHQIALGSLNCFFTDLCRDRLLIVALLEFICLFQVLILYIKVTMSVCLSVRLFVCVGSAWKILPVTARSLWSVLGGGGRESPVKHGVGGASTGGEGPGGGELDRCIMHRVHTSKGRKGTRLAFAKCKG
jgi:hypothetical protein